MPRSARGIAQWRSRSWEPAKYVDTERRQQGILHAIQWLCITDWRFVSRIKFEEMKAAVHQLKTKCLGQGQDWIDEVSGQRNEQAL